MRIGAKGPKSLFESGAFNRALPPLRVVTPFISSVWELTSIAAFCLRIAGVRFGVPFIFGTHQAVGRRRLVLGSKMGVPRDHLQRSVPK